MTTIKSNDLLFGTDKKVKIINNCLIAQEGPNMVGKLSFNNWYFDYDSFFTSKITLQAGDTQPITYGFLGTDITFLLIKPIYVSTYQSCIDTDNYLEYYFADEPNTIRYLSNLMILSGTDTHRIPQLYIKNPSTSSVQVELFMATLTQTGSTTTLDSNTTQIIGLSYNSVISDQMYGAGITASTQFEILDSDDNVQMAIEYDKIDYITISSSALTIVTKSDDPIYLEFLSDFQSKQALSRMNWVMNNSNNNYLTKIYPSLDTTAPVITFKAHDPITVMDYINNQITKSNIIFRFIDNIIDYDNNSLLRDGIINNNNVDINIINNINGDTVSSITYDGYYTVTFSISDIATNSTTSTKIVLVDQNPPTIYYTSGWTTAIMDLTGNTQTPGTIEKDDIIRFSINYIWDDIDGIISNSATTVNITSGGTAFTNITDIGYYDITLYIEDYAGNGVSGNTTFHIIESYEPSIIFNTVSTGTSFTMSFSGSSAITYSDIISYSVSAVTDNYDTTLTVNDIVLESTDTSIPIISIGTYIITYSLTDSSGNEYSIDKTITVTV